MNGTDSLDDAASIKRGTVTASLIRRKLSAYLRQNGLALVLHELGRIERTIVTLKWLQEPALRRRVSAGLKKGEEPNALPSVVFFQRLGEIRDPSFENRRNRASEKVVARENMLAALRRVESSNGAPGSDGNGGGPPRSSQSELGSDQSLFDLRCLQTATCPTGGDTETCGVGGRGA